MKAISAFVKETPDSSLAPSAMWGLREKLTIYEPGNFHQTLTLPVPQSQSFSLQNGEK